MKKYLILALFIASNALASYVAPPQPVSKGGTGSTSQTASRAVTTDSNGHIVSTSSVTDTELGYVHNVTSAIQTQLNGKQATLTPGNASTSTTGVTVSGTGVTVGPSLTIDVQTASGSQPGLLSASDWSTFNGKQAALSLGNLTDAGTDGITVTGGSGATVGSVSLSQHVADSTHNGYLSSSDYNSFAAASSAWTIVDGGDAAYSILSGDRYVRAKTTLTAGRAYTLPACTTSKEQHDIKNLPAQTFNITVTAAGGDLIDGASTFVLAPGDEVSLICADSGVWDVK